MKSTAQLMSASEIDRTLVRLTHEILEKAAGLGQLCFVGIRRRGLPIAVRLARKIAEMEKRQVPVGELDISLYRDDLSAVGAQPIVNATKIPFPVNGLDVILVDDVLFTGRTVRAALNALFDFGRPSRVQLLTLVDRGHRELPIAARYVGRSVSTKRDQMVEVRLREIDEEDKVLLMERN
jgi:pyrimidine operon attenuation protein/uracil phosphoribosyltransferase